MGLPGQVQELAFLPPHLHFSPPAEGREVTPTAADGHGADGIEGRRKDALAYLGPGKRRVLHLDALQVRPTNGEPGEIQAAQVAVQVLEQADHVGRTIALRSRILDTELREQSQ